MASLPRTVILPNGRVSRVAHAGTPRVHGLLRHLRRSGLDCVPEPLALCGDREELAFMPGVCHGPAEPRGELAWSPDTLARLGRAVRRCHDASVAMIHSVDLDGWFPFAERCAEPEVVCHNDLGPWNVPIGDGSVAIIDWEMAAPGRRIWDVAHIAWNWLPLYSPAERERMGATGDWDLDARLGVLLGAYGGSRWSRSEILDEVLRRQERVLELIGIARSGRAPLLANWAAADEELVLSDKGFVGRLVSGLLASHPEDGPARGSGREDREGRRRDS